MNDTIKTALGTGLILIIPLLASLFIEDFNWDVFDFVFAGVLIFGTGMLYHLAVRRFGSFAYRIAVALALLASFLLIWINGAVGIIGSEDNPANALYVVVFITLFLGSIITRLRPSGMSRVMFVTAFVHALVPVVAFMIWQPDFGGGVIAIFLLNLAFASLWVGSGLMFRHAA